MTSPHIWTIPLGKRPCVLALLETDAGAQITLDDRPVPVQTRLTRYGTAYAMRLHSHRLLLEPTYDGGYQLTLDGAPVPHGEPQVERPAVPSAPTLKGDRGSLFTRRHGAALDRQARGVSVRQFVPDWSWIYTLALLVVVPVFGYATLAAGVAAVGIMLVLLFANLGDLTFPQRFFLAWLVTVAAWGLLVMLLG